jgi:hypothetical protein
MVSVRDIFSSTVKPPYVVVRRQVTAMLERRAGIRTVGHFTLEELGFSSEHGQRYEPSHWFALRRILPRAEVGDRDVFIDFGSGMGRVVYLAARDYPFHRVIGVELSDALHLIAEENLANTRPKLRARDVELVCADVLEYEIPADVTVIFFANPFTGEVFDSVVRRLVASQERHPRQLRVIYVNPIEERLLLAAGFQPVRSLRGLRPGREWSRSNAVRMYVRTAPSR